MTNITAVPYFYDHQIRRYIQQFIRLFAGFQFRMGENSDGDPIYKTVPVRYGDMSRVAAHIIKNNSENVVNTVPFISCYVSGLSINPEMRTYPQFEDKVSVIEKKYNDATNSYEEEQGNIYTLTRHQPVPYKLLMQTDIWTSNTEQKLQLLEQMLVLFNPSLNIHTNNNPLDWSTLSYVELIQTNWSNRSIPQGVDDIIDISTLVFEMPILINPPAKVTKNSMIHTIITNITAIPTDTASTIETAGDIYSLDPIYTSYQIVTLENYKTRLEVNSSGNATMQILSRSNKTTDSNGNAIKWENVLKPFGELRAGISQARFKTTSNPSEFNSDIIGIISFNENDTSKLNIVLDENTIPANTQDPVDAIIDPQYNYPGDGTLTAAAAGDRYLLLNDIPAGTAWAGISANKNDIIEYNGTNWVISFDASNNLTSEHYSFNLTTKDKLKWVNEEWVNAFEGIYNPGFWRLYL
jgi:hypothetical protein